MGNTSSVRTQACRAGLKQGVSDDELITIRQHLQQERAFGSKRFQRMAEKNLGPPGERATTQPANMSRNQARRHLTSSVPFSA